MSDVEEGARRQAIRLFIFVISALVFTIEFIVFVVAGISPYAAFGMALAIVFIFWGMAKKARREKYPS